MVKESRKEGHMFTRSRVDEASLVVKGDLGLLIKRYMFLQEALDKLLECAKEANIQLPE